MIRNACPVGVTLVLPLSCSFRTRLPRSPTPTTMTHSVCRLELVARYRMFSSTVAKDKWVECVPEQADRIDPLVDSPASVLDRKCELEGWSPYGWGDKRALRSLEEPLREPCALDKLVPANRLRSVYRFPHNQTSSQDSVHLGSLAPIQRNRKRCIRWFASDISARACLKPERHPRRTERLL